MPTNFSQGLETQAAPNITFERPVQDVSGNIRAAGEALTSLGAMFKQDKSDDALGTFSAELADVENQLIAYKQEEADLMEQMQAASAAADTNVLNDLSGKLTTLRAGRMQGTLSPTQARTYTNRLIKEYSMQYPALAQKVRSMANESMDNIREIHNELFSDDPIVKQARDTIADATKYGTSPANIVAMHRTEAQAELDLKTYQVAQAAGNVTKETTIQFVQSQALSSALVDSNKLFLDIANAMPTGNVTQDYVINQFAALRQEYIRKYSGYLVEGKAYTEEGLKQAMLPAFAIFDQIEVILKTTGGTLDEKVKLAKMLAEKATADRTTEAIGLGSMLGGIFKYLPPDKVFDAVSAAAQIATSTQYGKGFGMEDWAVAARSAAGMGQMDLGMGMMILQSDQGQKVVGELVGIKAFGGNPASNPGMQDPALDAVSNRAVNDMISKMMDPNARKQIAGNALPYFSWIDIKKNPAILSETQNDPALATLAVEKAAGWASEWLIDMQKFGLKPEDIVINHSNMQSPITIKGESVGKLNWNTYFQGRTPDYRELEALPVSERLNFMYRDIINTYGAAGVNQWLDMLGFKAEGGYRKPEPSGSSGGSGDSKKKVTETKFDKDFFSAEKKHNLPNGILAEVAKVESDFNPNAIGPVLKDGTRAMGLMQIIPKYHPGVNAMNPSAAIDYAGGYLRRLYDQFGSWDKALAAYNWGEGNLARIADDPNWKQRLPSETKKYLQAILEDA